MYVNQCRKTGKFLVKHGGMRSLVARPVDADQYDTASEARKAALATIWRETHVDYRGHDSDGDKSIMLNASEGGGLCKLSALTDEQIRARVPDYKGR